MIWVKRGWGWTYFRINPHETNKKVVGRPRPPKPLFSPLFGFLGPEYDFGPFWDRPYSRMGLYSVTLLFYHWNCLITPHQSFCPTLSDRHRCTRNKQFSFFLKSFFGGITDGPFFLAHLSLLPACLSGRLDGRSGLWILCSTRTKAPISSPTVHGLWSLDRSQVHSTPSLQWSGRNSHWSTFRLTTGCILENGWMTTSSTSSSNTSSMVYLRPLWRDHSPNRVRVWLLWCSQIQYRHMVAESRHETWGGWVEQKTKGPECKWQWGPWILKIHWSANKLEPKLFICIRIKKNREPRDGDVPDLICITSELKKNTKRYIKCNRKDKWRNTCDQSINYQDQH